VLSYLPLAGLDPLQFLDHWDLLVFVEATIYGVDEEVERAALAGADNPATHSPALAALNDVLQARGLMTAGVQEELRSGLVYWAFESRLAGVMLRQPTVPVGGHDLAGISLGEIHSVAARKSFDYRVLNHLLHAIIGAEPDNALLDFLAVDEVLLDLGDDAVDYEEDVVQNSFNIFRLYVHLFGQEAPLRLIKHISMLEAQHARLLKELPPSLQHTYKRRRSQAAEGEGALRWVLPTPILNEAKFRAEHCCRGSDDGDG
jgi:hypothetical protein